MSDTPTQTRPNILLDRESATFTVYEPEGEVARSVQVSLGDLIENGNPALLLGWGILTQLTALNMQIAEAAARVKSTPPVEDQMAKAAEFAGAMLSKMNFGQKPEIR